MNYNRRTTCGNNRHTVPVHSSTLAGRDNIRSEMHMSDLACSSHHHNNLDNSLRMEDYCSILLRLLLGCNNSRGDN